MKKWQIALLLTAVLLVLNLVWKSSLMHAENQLIKEGKKVSA